MDSKLSALIEFHNAVYSKTGYNCSDQHFEPFGTLAKHRDKLHIEEFEELSSILLGNDKDCSLEHLLKEICDVLYVVYGTVITFGLADILDEAFNRVHENNMLKFTNGTILKETGKFIKPPNHPKVYLKDLTGEELDLTKVHFLE